MIVCLPRCYYLQLICGTSKVISRPEDQRIERGMEGQLTYHFNGQLDVVLTHATVVVLCLQRVRLESSCSSATRCRCRLDQQTHRRLHEPRSTTGEATLLAAFFLFFLQSLLVYFGNFQLQFSLFHGSVWLFLSPSSSSSSSSSAIHFLRIDFTKIEY